MARRLATSPGLARQMLPRLARAQWAGRIARRFPAQMDLDALRRWDRRVDRLVGALPG